ncbi:PAS domain S-box protein [candidate division WOR-3 bacterium]|nr:PAS domain S-box protein [candidate division WOR-3 bacterium]
MTIRIKTQILVFSLIVVFAIVSIIVNETISKRITKQQIYSHLETNAYSRAHHIETYLEEEKEAINQLSESIIIERYLLTDKHDKNYTNRRKDVMRRLEYTVRIEKSIYDIFVLDKNGIIVASSDKEDIGRDKSNDPYFLGGKKGAFIKDAYISSKKKRSTIAFSAPIYDEDYIVFLGVIVARVSTEKLDRITTDRTGLGKTGEIYLVNREGYMITPSRFVDNSFLKLKVDTENTRICFRDVGLFGTEEHEHEPVVCKNYLDENVIGIHAHIHEMGWALLAEISEKEAFAPVFRIRYTILLILFILLAGGITFAVFISRTITQPIKKLRHGTEEIIKGNLDLKVGTRAKDEIGQLSRAFDKMTNSLKKSREEVETYSKHLEKEVEERTNELSIQLEKSEQQRMSILNIMQDIDESNINLKLHINKRRKVEKKLQESEKKYRELINNSIDGVISVDMQMNITIWNPGAEKIFGYTEKEILGQSLMKIVPQRYRKAKKKGFNKFKKTGISLVSGNPIELAGIRKDGTEVPVELAVSIKKSGKKHFSTAVIRDISIRKRAEEALQESEERFRLAFEEGPVGMAIIDRDYTIHAANKILCLMFEYSEKELTRLTLADISHPDDIKKEVKLIENLFKGKTPNYRLVKRYIKKSKEVLWGNLTVTVLRFSESKPPYGLVMIEDITERKKTEEKLQYQANLLQNVSDAIISYDTDFNIRTWNKAAEDMYGWKENEVFGKPVYKIIKTDFPNTERDKVIKQFYKKGYWNGEVIEKRKDDSILNVRSSVSMIKDTAGNQIGAIAVNRDITELKKAEDEMRQSEEKYRNIVELAPDGIIMLDLKGAITSYNTAFSNMTGYSKDEIIGKYFSELPTIQMEDIHKLQNIISSRHQIKNHKPFEINWIRKDGTKGSAEVLISLMKRNDKVSGFQAIVRDITERKKVEQALKESEERYRFLVEMMSEGFAIQDENGVITYVNDAFCKMVEYSKDELIGLPVFDLLDETNKKIALERIKKQENEWSENYDIIWTTKDERKIHTIVSPAALHDSYGNYIGSFAVLTDITKRKRIEEHIRESLKEKEVLLKEIHHRVKNNMQIISSLLNLQSRYITDKQAIEMFTESQDRIKSMALVHEKLYRSKDFTKINFKEYIESLSKSLLRSYDEKRSKITLKINVSDVLLGVDYAIPCGLVINELVSNSLKHAFPEGKEGEITISFQSPKINEFILIVGDNGIGLPKDFDFNKTESLGLYLVSILAKDQLQGKISVDGTKGTKFQITFEKVN